ncbi:MAG: hypothetical protein A3K19_01235 [Lentisphaerae bacterium RIFOXYB12_FULL_65_16]|nr:MAG: hypothetical protein A3K18_33795 [Lentisphaerae bacterium RIFOXYA12_64_32]OGV92513.1 MAG: hypothetical protein A3K19_01235 [Lentisphaerae bacterium RIFOXYB12_FULL_65_16]
MAEHPTPEVIRLEALTKSFLMGEDEVQALRGLSFTLRRGEYLAIMGQSGSGKSTLLNILGCLDLPTSGVYAVEGTDVAQLSDEQLSALRREKFGFIFQSFNLISQLSVVENIEVPLFYLGWEGRRRSQRARELAESVGLGHRLGHRPFQLSGGQQQRVAIARALANEPHLIFADEPTGNLDSSTGKEIIGMLDSLSKAGRTLIMVTHERTVAEHAHRIIELADGLVVKDEPTT